jgi:REP element-mobilizing transposase RayT
LVFIDRPDRHVYLRLLEQTVARFEWRLLSYCLMRNHVHLLVETPRANLGLGMQWIHGQYGRHYVNRHKVPGHVFHRPYGSKRVKDEAQLWTAIRYIAQNPVDAGLCETAAGWEWSSHAGVVGRTAPAWVARGRLLEYFEGLGGVPAERYAALVG